MRDQHDRLGEVSDDALGQARLIVGNQRHDVAARDVTMIDDGEPDCVEEEVDRPDPATGDRRADGPAVDHAGEDEVVDVLCRPSDLIGTVTAWQAATNYRHNTPGV